MLLANKTSNQLSESEKIESLESHMLDFPQVECPVIHHFGPGIYIREVHLKAGTLAIGHHQRFEHLNLVMAGAVAMVEDGKIKIIDASSPLIFTGQPGRKFGYVLRDTIWQNIYPTNERDIDTLEATFLDKSESWALINEHKETLMTAIRADDRSDFQSLLNEIGMTDKEVRQQSENDADLIPMPEMYAHRITIRNSPIEGKGVFLDAPVGSGEFVAPARIGNKRTPVGRYANHSKNPNTDFIFHGDDVYLVALRPIAGCSGGDPGEEITVDYRKALSLNEGVRH